MVLSRPLTVSELLLLNEELQLALRSGASLELGLRDSARHLPGRLKQLAEQLSRHMDSGQSLPQALAQLEPPPPAIYRILVEAGLRGDQLQTVLKQLDDFGRAQLETRESLRRAIIYPLSILVTAYAVLCLTVWWGAPPLRSFLADIPAEPNAVARAIFWLFDHYLWWVIGLPAAFLLLTTGGLLWDWCQSGKLGSLGLIRFVPGYRKFLSDAQVSQMANLLALQIEHGVPFPDALRRCADFVSSSGLSQDCETAAECVESGRPIERFRHAPRFLQWLITVPSTQVGLAENARQAAQLYRDRSRHQAELVAMITPAILTLVLGTTIVGTYAWAVMDSLKLLWNRLMIP